MGGQAGLAVAILAEEQRGLEAVHERGRGQRVAFYAAIFTPRLGGRGQHGPVNALQRGGVEMGNVARLACDGVQVACGVGQPLVRGLGVVAVVAAAHGFVLRLSPKGIGLIGRARLWKCGSIAGAAANAAASKIVHGALQVLAQVQTPRVEGQVVGAGGGAFLEVDRVVEREVAVGAFHLAGGVDVPGPREVRLAGQVHAGVSDLLPSDDLTGGQGRVKLAHLVSP